MNGWYPQALGGHERHHDDDFGMLGPGIDPRTRMREVLERRSVFAVEEPT